MGENMYIVVRLFNKIEYCVRIDNCVLVLGCEKCLTDRSLSLEQKILEIRQSVPGRRTSQTLRE